METQSLSDDDLLQFPSKGGGPGKESLLHFKPNGFSGVSSHGSRRCKRPITPPPPTRLQGIQKHTAKETYKSSGSRTSGTIGDLQAELQRQMQSLQLCIETFLDSKEEIASRLWGHQLHLQKLLEALASSEMKAVPHENSLTSVNESSKKSIASSTCIDSPVVETNSDSHPACRTEASVLAQDDVIDKPVAPEPEKYRSTIRFAHDVGSRSSVNAIKPEDARSVKVRGSQITLHMKSKFFDSANDVGRNIPDHFENLFAILIVINALYMGYTLHYHSEDGHHPSWAPAFDIVFCILFLSELGMRIYCLRTQFVLGDSWAWNMFDFIVVSCMVIDEILRRMQSLTLLSTLRVFRVARVLKTVKIIRYFGFVYHGKLLILSIKAASGACSSIIAILLAIVYLLALIMTSGALDHCNTADNEHQTLCVRFGTLWRSCSSGYQVLLGGIRWGIVVDALDDLEWPFVAIFVIVITFCLTALMHVFTGMFVWIVRDVADREDKCRFASDHLEERRVFMERMTELFNEVDLNSNGVLSKDELKLAFKNEKICALFIGMELDALSVENVFDLLDVDLSGFVNMDEFAFGCLRLRGKARAVDLERARRDLVAVRAALDQIKSTVVRISRNLPGRNDELQHTAVYAKKSLANPSLPTVSRQRRKSSEISRASDDTKISISTIEASSFESRIHEPELRALTLSELQDVTNTVKQLCYAEAWADPRTSKLLEPEDVNLYHFTFHYISPRTSLNYIKLVGLANLHYRSGQSLTQVHSENGHIIARAEVFEDCQGTDVKIKLVKGLFLADDSSQYRILYDDEAGSLDCGSSRDVVYASSISSLSYKELVSSTPTKPQWFVCHWWGEPIFDFVRCCQEHSLRRGKDKYWVCAYANRQHDLGADIGDDPENSCFHRAMSHADGLLLVLDASANPFQRIWCCFELFKTVTSDKMLDIIAMKEEPRLLTQRPIPGEQAIMKFLREKEFPLGVLTKGICVRLENGNASVQTDKVNILQSMGTHPSTGAFSEELQQQNLDFANRRLRSYMAIAAWPEAIKKRCVLNFDHESSAVMGLPEVLHQDSDRSTLEMFFSGMQEVADAEVELISQGLPSKLTELSLSFEGCSRITDAGLIYLADRMNVLPLQTLVLDLGGCRLLTDEGIKHLATKLPSTLADVNLQFSFIPKISKNGAKALADHLPASVCRLRAAFRGTQFDHQFDALKQLKKLTR